MPLHFPDSTSFPQFPDSDKTKLPAQSKSTPKSSPPKPERKLLDLFGEKTIQSIGSIFGETGRKIARTVVVDMLPIDSPEYKTKKIYDYSLHLRNWAQTIIKSGDRDTIDKAIQEIGGRLDYLTGLSDSETVRMETTELSDLYDQLIDAHDQLEHQSQEPETKEPPKHA